MYENCIIHGNNPKGFHISCKVILTVAKETGIKHQSPTLLLFVTITSRNLYTLSEKLEHYIENRTTKNYWKSDNAKCCDAPKKRTWRRK